MKLNSLLHSSPMGFTATRKLSPEGLAAAKHHGAGYEGLELVPHHGSPGDPSAHAAVAIADASGYESDATIFSEGTLSDDDDDRASGEGLLLETGRLLSDAPPGAKSTLFLLNVPSVLVFRQARHT